MAGRFKRQISWLMIVVMAIPWIFMTDWRSVGAAAESGAVSYRNVVYALDSDNRDQQGIYYHIANNMAAVGNISASGSAGYKGKGNGIVVIPDAIEKDGVIYDVNEIGQYAFSCCTVLEEITVGDNVREISQGAFAQSGLKKIHIGKQVETIDITWDAAFCKTKLEQVTIDPENTAYCVKDGVLFSKDMTVLVRYPNQDSRIHYIIPDSVKKIAMHAFESTKLLKDLVIPSGVEAIGSAAFEYSSALYPVQDLRNVRYLGSMAFSDTKNLKTVLLRENLKFTVGGRYRSTNDTFMHSDVEHLYLKNGTVTSYQVIDGNEKLKNVILGDGIVLHRLDLAYCKALDTVILPADLKEIPAGFAKKCPNLKRIYIPETVTKIGDDAFLEDDIILYGKKDSAAEKYAEETGHTFVDIDTHTHHYEKYIFYQDDDTETTGMFCRECGDAYGCSQRLLREPEIEVSPGTDPTESKEPMNSPSVRPESSMLPQNSPVVSPETSTVPIGTPAVSPKTSTMPTVAPSASPETSTMPTVAPSASPKTSTAPRDTPSVSPETSTVPTDAPPVSPKTSTVPRGTPVVSPKESTAPTDTPPVSPKESTVPTDAPVVSPKTSTVPKGTPPVSPKESTVPTDAPVVSPETSTAPRGTPPVSPKTSTVPRDTPPVSPKSSRSPDKSPTATSKPDKTLTKKKLSITGFQVLSNDNRSVRFRWSKNSAADKYYLYYSLKRDGDYKILKILSGKKKSYVYKRQKAGKLYYYKLCAAAKQNGRKVTGPYTKEKGITITGMRTPVITVTKKKAGAIPYLSVKVKRADADKVELSVATNQGKYKQIPLRINSIRKLKGVYRIRYEEGKKTFRLRLRTWKILQKKKIYSEYSVPVVVKV